MLETSTRVSILAHGIASFPWKARDDNELNFARGDKIEIYEMAEMRFRGSVVGTSSNKSGWFPKSYVKLTEGERGKRGSVI